jgi:hypothetical protein
MAWPKKPKNSLNIPPSPVQKPLKGLQDFKAATKLKPEPKTPTGAPAMPGMPKRKPGRPKKYRPGT